jgi:response regulator RpfG family c-di-GMP phosphodiesterase
MVEAPQQETLSILFVDDEEYILRALSRLFVDEGYEVITARSGAEGLEVLKEREIAVVVSDLGMPRMSGAEFLRKVEKASPDTVRMILTGFTDPVNCLDVFDEELHECISKPWDNKNLVRSVRSAIERYRLTKRTTDDALKPYGAVAAC